MNWTDEGIRNVKGTTDRAEAARAVIERHGGSLTGIYWTIGPYDAVIGEAPDDETMTAAMLEIGSRGNTRSTTLRAFDAEEMKGILERVG